MQMRDFKTRQRRGGARPSLARQACAAKSCTFTERDQYNEDDDRPTNLLTKGPAMRRILLVGLLLLCPMPLFAQERAKRAITIDDYFTQADLFEVAYSGRHIAYTEGRWKESTDDRKT